jgi:tetratricopeptide (TPR) repeat protein
MVLPRGKLIRFSEKKIRRLRNKLADSAEGKGALTKYEREAVLKQIEKIKELIQTVRELQPYEDEVAFRIGQIYRKKKRFWEGYVLFNRLYTEKPGSDISEAAIVELAITLYDLKEVDRAETLIKTYLDKNIKGRSAPTLLSLLMRDSLSKKDSVKMVSYKKYLDRLPTDNLEDAQKETIADLHYMMGFGFFQKGAYDQAAEQFTIIIDDFPETDRAAQGYYFCGMALMMQAKYQDALDRFTTYSEKFKKHEFDSDAQFRSAVCSFGLTQYDEAEKKFTDFIENFSSSIYVSEAYSMRADILAAKDSSEEGNEGALDAAIADYRKALDLSIDDRQAAYAVFRAAQVYQLEGRWQEIIDLMNYYLEKKEETAKISKAIYWIGKAQISQGQVKKALQAYVNAVFKYGNNCSLDGVDKIITELVAISEKRLSKADRDDLLYLIKEKAKRVDASEKTLILRAKTLIAAMQGEEAMKTLGQALLKSEQDLSSIPPTGLALMCNAAVDTKDVKQMERLYTYFTSTYEDSSQLWTAYRARAYQFEIQKDYVKLLPLLDEALDQYGPESYMDWAQIMKARTYLAMKDYKTAKEEFALILTVSSWRGPIFAEAMYRIGQTHEALNELTKAHAFYQRTYVQYRAFGPEWAAKAYLAAADVLLKLNSKDEAIKTWKRMLTDVYVKDLEETKEAKKMLKKYEGS